ncbi:MAG: S16 family serine protease [Halobacteria archaeon]
MAAEPPAGPNPPPPPAAKPRRRWVLPVAVLLVGLLLGLAFYAGTRVGGPRDLAMPPLSPEAREVSVKVPGIDTSGEGVIANLTARVQPGGGLVLVSVNNAKAAPDTQVSALTAARVAANLTGRSLGAVDVIYSVQADAQVVEGPSAGAAMAVAAAAALEGRTPNPRVAITGTVEPDGSVGAVGGVEEKAAAARDKGVTLFLVAPGQNTAGRLAEPVRRCLTEESLRLCTVEFEERRVDLGGRLGIRVAEVATVKEALERFYE